MHSYIFKKGSTNISIELEIIDSTDGTPETGVLWNTAGIDLQYRRDGAVSTAITEATLAALTTAHTDGGFLHIGNGVYRFDLPDAALASGQDKVVIHGTVTGMVVIPVSIQLVDYDPFDTVRLGLTSLPNAAADAAGGLPISDAGGLPMDDLPLTAEFEARTIVSANYALQATTDDTNTVVTNNALALADIKGSGFLTATDSLVAIRDRGDAAWATATGFSTFNPAADNVIVGTINANTITAASITASAMDGKGDWNIGKTGYSLTQTFPTNFSSMVISVSGDISSDLNKINGVVLVGDGSGTPFNV